jgi:hypothetical protein
MRRLQPSGVDGKMTPQQMAELARKRLRLKIPQLIQALTGKVTDHHRFMLKMLLDQIEHIEQQIAELDRRIEQVMGPLELTARKMLDEIPGIDLRAAENILAEIGADMSQFPTADHLASWAGLCPGNNQSGGKRRSGRMPQGNRWLKATLNQCAWAAGRKKDSYFAAQHHRIAARRGVKRATMAVAHSILCISWELLKHGQAYQDLGRNYFERTEEQRITEIGFAVLICVHPCASVVSTSSLFPVSLVKNPARTTRYRRISMKLRRSRSPAPGPSH